MDFYKIISILVALISSPSGADEPGVFSRLKDLLGLKTENTRPPNSVQYYVLDNQLDNKPVIVLEISNAVLKEIETVAADKVSKDTVNDSNFDTIHRQQNIVLDILKNFKIEDRSQDFYNLEKSITVLIEIINLATTLFPLNEYPTEQYKELEPKFLALLENLKVLCQEYEICGQLLVLCSFLFRISSDDNNFISSLEKLDHSQKIQEATIRFIVDNQFNIVKTLLPLSDECYEELTTKINTTARTKSDLFPSRLLFVAFTVLREYLNNRLTLLNDSKVKFNSTVNSYRPKIDEIIVGENFQQRELLIKLLSLFKKKVSSQRKLEAIINRLIETRANMMAEIIKILEVFNKYDADDKILRKIEETTAPAAN